MSATISAEMSVWRKNEMAATSAASAAAATSAASTAAVTSEPSTAKSLLERDVALVLGDLALEDVGAGAEDALESPAIQLNASGHGGKDKSAHLLRLCIQ